MMNVSCLGDFSVDCTNFEKPLVDFDSRINTCYDLVLTNVKNLSKARVICIGETHHIEEQLKDHAALVDLLFNGNAVLLVEEDSKSEIVKEKSQAMYVSSEIPIFGWDFPDSQDLKDFVHASLLSEKPQEFVYEVLGDELKRFSSLDEISWSESCMITAKMACLKTITSIFSSFISSYYENKALSSWQQVINQVYDRNVFMNQQILKALEKYEKVIVVAGKNHFIPPSEDPYGTDMTPALLGVEKTWELFYQNDIPFIILEHK